MTGWIQRVSRRSPEGSTHWKHTRRAERKACDQSIQMWQTIQLFSSQFTPSSQRLSNHHSIAPLEDRRMVSIFAPCLTCRSQHLQTFLFLYSLLFLQSQHTPPVPGHVRRPVALKVTMQRNSSFLVRNTNPACRLYLFMECVIVLWFRFFHFFVWSVSFEQK